MQDMHQEIKYALALTPVDRTATVQGNIIDRKGFDAVTFAVISGAVAIADGSNFFTFTIEEGDQANMSDAAAAPAAAVQGTSPVINHATNFDDKFAGKLTYRGTKRYCRLVATETGTAQALFGAIAALWNPDKAAVVNTAPA